MIYFISAGRQYIKIGYTADSSASKRLYDMQIGCPLDLRLLGTMPGDRGDEWALHRRWADQQHRGEWFRTSRELRTFIKEVATPPMDQFEFLRGTWSSGGEAGAAAAPSHVSTGL